MIDFGTMNFKLLFFSAPPAKRSSTSRRLSSGENKAINRVQISLKSIFSGSSSLIDSTFQLTLHPVPNEPTGAARRFRHPAEVLQTLAPNHPRLHSAPLL